MDSTIQNRRSTFAFKPAANEIQYVPLNYSKYEDYGERLTKEKLVNYICGEVERMQADRDGDVQECQTEYNALGNIV